MDTAVKNVSVRIPLKAVQELRWISTAITTESVISLTIAGEFHIIN